MYNTNMIPEWVIRKNCRGIYLGDAACILAIMDGTCAFTKETEKALLFEWTNTMNGCKCAGGSFWVAKSLLK